MLGAFLIIFGRKQLCFSLFYGNYLKTTQQPLLKNMQKFLLKGLINHYKTLGSKDVVPNVHIIHS